MHHQTPTLCVVGSSNIDLTFRVSRLPAPGETLTGRDFLLGYGGKGANQAVMAARLGARVFMVSKVGRDVFGDGMLANYRAHGVDITHVFEDTNQFTGVAGILVDDLGGNRIIVIPGANHRLTPGDIQRAQAAIAQSQLLLCQFEVHEETVIEAFRIAKSAGVRTILNPAPARPLPEELPRLTDFCVPNETEIEQLTGQPAATIDQAIVAAQTLRRRGPRTVILTLGARGVVIVDADHVDHLPALPVTAVDTTGAGDAFIGSLAVYLGEGFSLRSAVRRANGVAALSVTRLGAQAALPSREETDAFLKQWVPDDE